MIEDQQDNFIDETLSFIDSINSTYKLIKQGKGGTQAVETLLRLAHTIEGSATKLDLEALASYCMKLERLLLKIKEREGKPSTAEYTVLFESEEILKSNLKKLSFNKKATFEADGHLSKLNMLIHKKGPKET